MLSSVVQIKSGTRCAGGSYFEIAKNKKKKTRKKNYNCECGQPERFNHFLKEPALFVSLGKRYSKKTSPFPHTHLISVALLDNKKRGTEGMVKVFLDPILQHLMVSLTA
jgi:hypothetical protein